MLGEAPAWLTAGRPSYAAHGGGASVPVTAELDALRSAPPEPPRATPHAYASSPKRPRPNAPHG